MHDLYVIIEYIQDVYVRSDSNAYLYVIIEYIQDVNARIDSTARSPCYN